MSARTWLSAARPATLPAAAAPVAVGTACAAAAGGFAAAPALAALAGALLLQIGANFANDLSDARRGADGPDRLGPTRAVAAGLLTARAVAAAAALAFALATACGAYLAAVAGWPVIAIGVASIACAVAYTGGPWPLGYHGLGDVFVLAFFGFAAVCGTAFVQAGHVPALAWWLALPVGAHATAILVVNNLRDRAGDARVGKRTLAVRLGRGGAIAEYAALVAVAHAVPAVLVAAGAAPPLVLASLATAPWAARLVRDVARRDGRALDPLLGATARLLLVHAFLLAGTLVVASR